jgi:translation initiation factor IF-2
MPVRIYEIAKKLNLESKFVLNKAKELGIAAAKVPSSTLDKITAEFLEEQLAPLAKPFEPSKPVEVTPVTIIHAPPPPPPPAEPEPAPEPVAQLVPSFPAPVAKAASPAPSPASAPVESFQAPKEEFSVAPVSEVHHAAAEVIESQPPETKMPAPPIVAEDRPAVVEEVVIAKPAGDSAPPQVPVAESVAQPLNPTPSPEPGPVSAAQPATPAPQATPAPPATPPAVQTGQLVGRIDLSQFGYGGRTTRGVSTPPPARPATPPPRDDRRGPPPPQQGRPGPSSYQGSRPGQPQRPGQYGRPGQMGGRPGVAAGPGPRPAPAAQRPQFAADAPTIIMRPPIVVRELAEQMGKKPFQIIGDLMQMGVFATVTQTIDAEAAVKICAKHGIRFETEKRDKAAHSVNVPKEEKLELDSED